MRTFVDPDTCMGCGVCETICPEVFRLAEEPYAKVLVEFVPPELEADVREAMDQCPEQAISIGD